MDSIASYSLHIESSYLSDCIYMHVFFNEYINTYNQDVVFTFTRVSETYITYSTMYMQSLNVMKKIVINIVIQMHIVSIGYRTITAHAEWSD